MKTRLIVIIIAGLLLSAALSASYLAGKNQARSQCQSAKLKAVAAGQRSREVIEKRVRGLNEKAVIDRLHSNNWMRNE